MANDEEFEWRRGPEDYGNEAKKREGEFVCVYVGGKLPGFAPEPFFDERDIQDFRTIKLAINFITVSVVDILFHSPSKLDMSLREQRSRRLSLQIFLVANAEK